MQPEEIHLYDAWRIFIGQVPGAFLIEAVIRAVFVFTVLITSMRLLGKRMAGQLSRNEMIAMTSLAAATGVPIQAPDRGLLPALIIAIIVVMLGRLISRWACRSERFESLSQDKLGTLVQDSVLQLPELSRTSITRERLFAHLRSEGLTHLGQVKRVYFEAGGFFTLIRNEFARPGLTLIPTWDTEFIAEQGVSADVQVCARCGNTRTAERCSNCHATEWQNAITGEEIK
ncbi:DUF421 domain-containing protein [Fulvivirgaceae bacterium PWU5]|uniref:DUF421 domain-containing protein n=1 Tax=Dawidia cretensis TaxID=2782350 RepID=A0AAP2GTV9_9BACT|nr:YetF domain-containing protein [Dawidia cretensis]MBT1707955.1 DUF421 domain-containing protein [Dawidia cretensis]